MDSLVWMTTLYQKGLNGILADEMGMGKTIQSMAIIAWIYQFKKNKGPHLILVPKSTIPNWMREAEKWLPDLKFVNLRPTADVRDEIIENELRPGTFNVCVTTYEAVNICKSYIMKVNWHYFIMDEAHKLKNSESKTHTLCA